MLLEVLRAVEKNLKCLEEIAFISEMLVNL